MQIRQQITTEYSAKGITQLSTVNIKQIDITQAKLWPTSKLLLAVMIKTNTAVTAQIINPI